MIWVYARPVAAEVVNLDPVRYSANEIDVRLAMGQHFSIVDTGASITVRFGPKPIPALSDAIHANIVNDPDLRRKRIGHVT